MPGPYYLHRFTEDEDGVPSDQTFVDEYGDVQDALTRAELVVFTDAEQIVVVSNSQGRVIERVEA